MNLFSVSIIVYTVLLIVLLRGLQLLGGGTVVKTVQLFLILVFSFAYIAMFDWRFLLCMIAVIIITWFAALMVEKTGSKVWLSGGVISLLSFLIYFKYADFFMSNIYKFIGKDASRLNIILPIGISFYIFSALSYIIDVYRREYSTEKNIFYVALYISCFTKLTAGPIVRGGDFFPQVKNYRGIKWETFEAGMQIFVFGLFKKIVLADHLGVFVDDVFHAPTAFNTGTMILAAVSYSLQIYFDFSGYSDMAIGLSKILGFEFKPNFNLPYIAQNVSEFWKRWHISLSSWFQDYVYIPLGGSRKRIARTCINLMTVMLLSGLWHGASWSFVVWGGLHGFASCLNKTIGKKFKVVGSYINILLTFIIVTLFWVVFRADNFSTAVEIWVRMITPHTGINQPYTWSFFAIVCLIGANIAAVRNSKRQSIEENKDLIVKGYYPVLDLSKFWPRVAFLTFCGLTVIMGYFGNTAFIYGQF